jgi:hypothetical protein
MENTISQNDGITIQFNNKKALEMFYNALCNSLGYMCSSYDLRLWYSKTDYENAKNEIQKANPNTFICYEDVLVKIIELGGELRLIDEEGGMPTESLTYPKLVKNIANTPINHLLAMINENDDATTGDVIIQQCFYNDVIFG